MLFAVRHIRLRREAVIAGFLAGPLAMAPGIIFYIILLGQYPGVIDMEAPLFSVLQALQVPGFALLFSIVIFGTYMESGIAMVHSVNERIASLRHESGNQLSRYQRVIIAIVLLVASIYLATSIGLVDLIGKGYGTLTYLMLAVYVLPLLVRGAWQILQYRNE